MPKKEPLSKNKAREHRIYWEIIVDCYDEIEQMLGWWYYLNDTLKFPFMTECALKRSISPLNIGETVEVIGMGALEDCANDMFVIIKWCGRKLGVPLSQLKPVKPHAKTKQAIEDWQYWLSND